jgi:hypothetical protein
MSPIKLGAHRSPYWELYQKMMLRRFYNGLSVATGPAWCSVFIEGVNCCCMSWDFEVWYLSRKKVFLGPWNLWRKGTTWYGTEILKDNRLKLDVVSLLLRLLYMQKSIRSFTIIRTISTRSRFAQLSSEQVLNLSCLGMLHIITFLDIIPLSHWIIEHLFKLKHHRVL